MQISQKLPQFDKKSLLVVAGTRAADIYFAFEGEIDKKKSIKMDAVKYSDKEGFFMRLGKGKMFGAGSVLEDKDEEENKKFIKELKENIEKIFKENNVDDIYLFASDYTRKILPDALASDIKEKILFTFQGNYIKSHPFNLIKKIKSKKESKTPKFISEAAMKILRKKK